MKAMMLSADLERKAHGSTQNKHIPTSATSFQAAGYIGAPVMMAIDFDDLPKKWISGDTYYSECDAGFEYYLKNGSQYLYHREGAAARYWINSKGESEEYFVNGDRHRSDGPAVIYGSDIPVWSTGVVTRLERIAGYMRCENQCYYEWWWQDVRFEFNEWVTASDLSKNEKALLLLRSA